jgi:hypothetical protein
MSLTASGKNDFKQHLPIIERFKDRERAKFRKRGNVKFMFSPLFLSSFTADTKKMLFELSVTSRRSWSVDNDLISANFLFILRGAEI